MPSSRRLSVRRSVLSPSYYLGRPAELWMDGLQRRRPFPVNTDASSGRESPESTTGPGLAA